MISEDLESRTVVISPEKALAVRSLKQPWILTASEIQKERMSDNRYLLIKPGSEPQVINARAMRTLDMITGNSVAYAEEGGIDVVYITGTANHPFLGNGEDLRSVLSNPYKLLSPEQSEALRRRGKRASTGEVERFVLINYPTIASIQPSDSDYVFFEIIGNG